MPPDLGGVYVLRCSYTSECHADDFDFERIEALKRASEACGISTLSHSRMLRSHKQMDNSVYVRDVQLAARHGAGMASRSSTACNTPASATAPITICVEHARASRFTCPHPPEEFWGCPRRRWIRPSRPLTFAARRISSTSR